MMEAVFRTVSGDQLRTLLISAEAGGGKSRVIEEFVRRISTRALVLSGDCIGQRQYPLSFAPFRAMLSKLVQAEGLAELNLITSTQDRGELARLLPEFGVPTEAADSSTGRAMLFEVVRRLFDELAKRQPLVLVVEDAHWADQATADLLRFLVGRLSSSPILLVISYRPEGLAHSAALGGLVADVLRRQGTQHLELPRLSRTDVASQLEGILGHQPAPGLVNRVYDKGAGVPLFTEALATASGSAMDGLPASLRDLLLMAIAELPQETRDILRKVALGGPQIAHSLLGRVAKLSDAVLAERLRPAVETGIIVTCPGAYAFRHALIADAVQSELLAGEILTIHRAYASALAQKAKETGDLGLLLSVARHWAGAEDASEACRAAWRAAKQAECAYSEQLGMLEIILAFWSRADRPESIVGMDIVGLLELAADAACWAGEAERGMELVELGLAKIGSTTRPHSRTALLLQRAMMRQQGLIPGELSDLREAMELAGGHARLRAEALGQMSRALVLRDRHQEARAFVDDMRQVAGAAEDEEYQLEADIDDAFLKHIGSRSAAFERALAEAAAAGSGRLEVLAAEGLLRCLCEEGRFEDVIARGWAAFDRTLALGQGRYMGAAVGYHLCRSLLMCGEVSQADDICERMAVQNPLPLGLAKVLECRADIAMARADLARAAQCIRLLRDLPSGPQAADRRAATMVRLEIDLAQAKGDPGKASALISALDTSRLFSFHWPVLAALARADVESRPTRLDQLADLARRLPEAGPVDRAYASTFAAEVSRAGQSDIAAWQKAAEAWEAMGARTWHAYCQVRCGTAMIVAGRRAPGSATVRQAVELVAQTDAIAMASEIESVAIRARVRLSDEGRTLPMSTPHGLTDREMEVLRLVAAGQTNREIATHLLISPKTASVHVSNILGKLAVPTRNAAAAIAHRLQLVGPV